MRHLLELVFVEPRLTRFMFTRVLLRMHIKVDENHELMPDM